VGDGVVWHNADAFTYHCEKHKSTMKGTVIAQP